MVIGTNPEKIQVYRKLHADNSPGVRDLLAKYNIRNFTIFIHMLDDGKEYLFGYYEYTGGNYQEDMARLEAEPQNMEWLKLTDSCQIPLKGENSWAFMSEIYHNK